jgi:4-amino-4-deoxy-L-arabinose transferase-like glycosyltransferase
MSFDEVKEVNELVSETNPSSDYSSWEKRKKFIFNWLKNPYNLFFFSIIVFALALRLYYFFMTYGQPLWWDEAVYMDMAKDWAFGIEHKFLPVRPVLFSFLIAGFLKIANNEFLTRFFLLILSIVSIGGTYYLGKELFDKKVGLLASFIMSVFYLNIFFTYRILVDIHSLAFFTLSAIFFYRYFKNNKPADIYLAAIFSSIGTLFKLSTGSILLVVLIYLLITEKLNFLKKKEIWISAIIFNIIFAPYLIWGYFKFGGFVLTQAAAWNAPKENALSAAVSIFFNYLKMFPTYLSWPLLIVCLLGIVGFYRLILGFDLLLKNKDNSLKRDLYLFLIFLIPIIFVSFMVGHNENRYIIACFPAVFIISGVFMMKVYDSLKKNSKAFGILFLIVILGLTVWFQIQSADSLIKNKINSYSQIRDAGLWIKENTSPEDVIISTSAHQVKYYSERTSFLIPTSNEEFLDLLSSKNPKYLMVSGYENHQRDRPWVDGFIRDSNLSIANIIFLDPLTRRQPMVIIYNLR